VKTSSTTLIATLLLASLAGAKAGVATKDEAFALTLPNTNPGPEYQAAAGRDQGVPGIAHDTNSGRLWATCYTSGRGETKENQVVVVASHDDGVTWTEPVLVIDPPDAVRTFDLSHLMRARLLVVESLSFPAGATDNQT
jgi:hypothetical protein